MLLARRIDSDWQDFETTTTSKPVFPELRFLRLCDWWQESSRFAKLNGDAAFAGKVFARYELKGIRHSWMDFTFRGHVISDRCAQAFRQMLSSPQVVAISELLSSAELLGHFIGCVENGSFVHRIDSAEVGLMHGQPILVVQWRLKEGHMRGVSVFIDAVGDGRIVHEIHFFSPEHIFDESVKHFNDTMRSAQWLRQTPPPLSSVA